MKYGHLLCSQSINQSSNQASVATLHIGRRTFDGNPSNAILLTLDFDGSHLLFILPVDHIFLASVRRLRNSRSRKWKWEGEISYATQRSTGETEIYLTRRMGPRPRQPRANFQTTVHHSRRWGRRRTWNLGRQESSDLVLHLTETSEPLRYAMWKRVCLAALSPWVRSTLRVTSRTVRSCLWLSRGRAMPSSNQMRSEEKVINKKYIFFGSFFGEKNIFAVVRLSCDTSFSEISLFLLLIEFRDILWRRGTGNCPVLKRTNQAIKRSSVPGRTDIVNCILKAIYFVNCFRILELSRRI